VDPFSGFVDIGEARDGSIGACACGGPRRRKRSFTIPGEQQLHLPAHPPRQPPALRRESWNFPLLQARQKQNSQAKDLLPA
jgi:hypothetical protein